MKLYLVKHLRAASLRKFGSLDSISSEKEKRAKRKYHKNSEAIAASFTMKRLHSSSGCKNEDEVEELDLETSMAAKSSVDVQNNLKIYPTAATKRKKLLLSMISTIRGVEDGGS